MYTIGVKSQLRLRCKATTLGKKWTQRLYEWIVGKLEYNLNLNKNNNMLYFYVFIILIYQMNSIVIL